MKDKTMIITRVSPSWKTQQMVKVGREYKVLNSKYKRYIKCRTQFQAHYVSDKEPRVADVVLVSTIRPLSSSKRHIAWPKE